MTMSTVPCVLQCGGLCDEATEAITLGVWEKLQENTLLWKDLDKFGDVHATVDWDKGPGGHCVHNTCKLTLSNGRKLEQAIKRQRKTR